LTAQQSRLSAPAANECASARAVRSRRLREYLQIP
jgi:hypothetical protein